MMVLKMHATWWLAKTSIEIDQEHQLGKQVQVFKASLLLMFVFEIILVLSEIHQCQADGGGIHEKYRYKLIFSRRVIDTN